MCVYSKKRGLSGGKLPGKNTHASVGRKGMSGYFNRHFNWVILGEVQAWSIQVSQFIKTVAFQLIVKANDDVF